ncbi:hypothetical protein B0J15DRAFT_143967 [Fusarium solani]|uniref:BZIP domain-containing protein n=1 Tax=Fusarium solani TaxID=169388 RepID=A0A9P9JUW8_FUSSL|nr:uncharacterized protein B0J15DRAFT_143967 [Fusarium solani]KAH7237898.1 hypothetical protein B0J15DRAFT_143967 [Fusarium solani]
MGDDLTFGTSYIPESLLWEQWWSSNQLVPFGTSEGKSSTSNGVYTQTSPLLDGFFYHYNTNSTDHWHVISHETDYMNSWNGLDPVIADTPLFSVPEHRISKESPPAQGHWDSLSTTKKPNRKQNCYSDDLMSRKSTGRTPLGDRDVNPQSKNKTNHSTFRRTRNASGNGAHPAQHGNNRIKRIQERNRIASNKLRVKQREEQLKLESSQQDLERIHHDLSTCVADLTFEVYELKMQILQHSGCNCNLIQNYLVHESSRYVQACEEKSQREASYRR